MTPIYVSDLAIIGSNNGSAISHYLNQCWNIVNSNLRNKLQWKLKRNSYIFIQENAFENLICQMPPIWSLSQCVNELWDGACWLNILTIYPWLSVRLQYLHCWRTGHTAVLPKKPIDMMYPNGVSSEETDGVLWHWNGVHFRALGPVSI